MELFIDDDFNDNYDFKSVRNNLYYGFAMSNPDSEGPQVFSNEDNTYFSYFTQQYPDIKKKTSVNFIREQGKEDVDSIKMVVVHITDTDMTQDHIYHHIISLSPGGVELTTHNLKLSDCAKEQGHTSFLTLSNPAVASQFEGHPVDSKAYQARFESEWIKKTDFSYDNIPDYLSAFDDNTVKAWDKITTSSLNVGYGDNSSDYGNNSSSFRH